MNHESKVTLTEIDKKVTPTDLDKKSLCAV